MLRGLVLLLLLLNAALFFWIRSDPPLMQADREPQRLERQVAPDAVQVLPDLPAASGPGDVTTVDYGGTPASAPAAGNAASAPNAANTGNAAPSAASGSTAALAHRTSDTDVDCAESAPLDVAQIAALRQALAKVGVPPDAMAERRQEQPGTWLVYLGRFSDAQTWQQQADELKRLNIKFDRVTQPVSLSPGLSLGNFSSATDASAHLRELATQGVKTARVVAASASSVIRRLQVRSTSTGWRAGAAGQHFSACAAASSAAL